MKPTVVTVSGAEFENECLALFADLEGGRVTRIIITRHGRPVAELTPPAPAWLRSSGRIGHPSNSGTTST